MSAGASSGIGIGYFGPVLKELYGGQTIENMVLKHHALLGMIKKNPNFFGDVYPQPIKYGLVQGRSHTFATAKANKSNSKYKRFNLERFADYSLASIPNEVIEASENDKGAFVRALKDEFDSAIETARESAARELYGNGSSSIGRIAAGGISGAVVTLSDPDDALKIEPDMYLVLSTADGGGTVKTGEVRVLSVDRSAGTFTCTGNVTTGIATAAPLDYIFVDGDYDLAAPGLSGWLPDTAPTAGDNFFGVDRSTDPERLGGLRFDGTSFSIEEALIKSASQLHARGASPDMVFLHYTDYANLEISLGSKVQYVMPTAAGRADISFQGIKLNNPKGKPLTVLPDTYARKNRAFMLTMSTWTLHSLKNMIRILDLDGNRVLRDSDADSVELRVGGYKVLGCSAPGWNANIQLA